MSAKPITLYYQQDPGHGWISCKRSLAAKLNFLDKVSSYSYQRGASIYLEEDCDAALLVDALDKAGIPYVIKSSHTDKRHPIRSYERFSYAEVLA